MSSVVELFAILQINKDSIVCPINNLWYIFAINCFKQGNQGFKEYENFLCNVIFAELTALSLIAWNQFNELEEIFLEDEVFAYI